MAHPLSLYLKKRKCPLKSLWIVCEWQSGAWWPRLDLKPSDEEEVARRFAAEQTKQSGSRHRALEFAATKRG